MFDETGDAAKAQGWTAARPRHQRQRQARRATSSPTSRSIRRRTSASPAGYYAMMPSPVDGSIWGTFGVFGGAGGVVRLDPGSIRRRRRSPRSTTSRCRATARAAATSTARASSGCRWRAAISAASTAASARARSTARKRPATSAPKAGASISIPGPASPGIGDNSAEASYYTWVDQHNTLGLGNDVPISTGNRE